MMVREMDCFADGGVHAGAWAAFLMMDKDAGAWAAFLMRDKHAGGRPAFLVRDEYAGVRPAFLMRDTPVGGRHYFQMIWIMAFFSGCVMLQGSIRPRRCPLLSA